MKSLILFLTLFTFFAIAQDNQPSTEVEVTDSSCTEGHDGGSEVIKGQEEDIKDETSTTATVEKK